MGQHSFSDIFLPDLGPASGLIILGFRSHAFGCSDRCCVRSGFGAALGQDADEALGDLLVFTRIISAEGSRRIGLTAPGCARMTADELSVICAFAAAQAWDTVARDIHLKRLLAGPIPASLPILVTRLSDTFAGHGLAFEVPKDRGAVPGGLTPSFRQTGGG